MSDLDLTAAIEAATREVSKQARQWPGDRLLHDVIPFEAADAAIRAAAAHIEAQVREQVIHDLLAHAKDLRERRDDFSLGKHSGLVLAAYIAGES